LRGLAFEIFEKEESQFEVKIGLQAATCIIDFSQDFWKKKMHEMPPYVF
jgi:hypothetical protein